MTPSRTRSRTRTPLALVAVLALGVNGALAACSSDPDDDAGPITTTTTEATTTSAPGTADETTTTAGGGAAPLDVLVSDDDGYDAEGIDVLVEALRQVDGVTVTVVAPLAQQSGTGGKTTEGDLAVTDVELPSGYAAKAVDGFPADTIRVAIDEEGLTPDVVITGINEGQNLGPAVDLSGTIGAARAAVERGIPALATSQGTDGFDYEAAVPFILDWVAEHRAALADGSAPVAVTNLNVPSCRSGEVRGLAEVEPDLTGDVVASLGSQDCSDPTPISDLEGDVAAFLAGYATISTVPSA